MKLVIWGAGKIGRGFIADIFIEGGYDIEFVDINRDTVNLLNDRREYSIFKADESGIREESISGHFRARHVSDDMSDIISEDNLLIDIAVFKNDLESVADMVAPIVEKRAEIQPESKMDFITNVNMTSPETAFREMLEARLSGGALEYLKNNMGVSGIFMMCISPDAQPNMLEKNPLNVYNNGFFEQAVDIHAFKGVSPKAPRLRLSDKLEAEEARKLYTLNMAHCLSAYEGVPMGLNTSYEASRNPLIASEISKALDEASTGLMGEFGFTETEMGKWKDTIFSLLNNPYMADPLLRLGADTRRKLSERDRLVMPAKLCHKHGGCPEALCRAIKAGYYFKNDDAGTAFVNKIVNEQGFTEALSIISGISKGDKLFNIINREE